MAMSAHGEERALEEMCAERILNIHRDAVTRQMVVLHVLQPQRFWHECIQRRMLPPPDLKHTAFLTARTVHGWGWVQCVYTDEGAEERPWLFYETCPSNPVGALCATEFTLVWRFGHSESLRSSLTYQAKVFMGQCQRRIEVTGPAAISKYLYHALPLGTDVPPYGTLLWYLRLEYLHSTRCIMIDTRSAHGRPIRWRVHIEKLRVGSLRAEFPPFFYSAVPSSILTRTANWMGLPFVRLILNPATAAATTDGRVCSVADLLNADRTGLLAGASEEWVVVEDFPPLKPGVARSHSLRELDETEGVMGNYNSNGVFTAAGDEEAAADDDAPQPKKRGGSSSGAAKTAPKRGKGGGKTKSADAE
jgi:hypothetical protein